MMTLHDREKQVLESIIRNYILSATPVGSRSLSKHSDLKVSPATIRNVMMDLEEAGLISQPHTSAGRIPTDKGYRVYVDNLIRYEELTDDEKQTIRKHLESIYNNAEEVMKNTSSVLSRLSLQFSMVLLPNPETCVLEKLELIQVDSNKILVLITFQKGLIESLVLSINTVIPSGQIEDTSRILNKRLSGLSIQEIQESIKLRLQDVQQGNAKLLKIIISSAPNWISPREEDSIYCDGAMQVTHQPEFADRKNLETIIHLLEHKETIANILSNRAKTGGITITIGDENPEAEIQSFSVITSSYRVKHGWGTLGIIGPKRMQYSKLIPLVHYTSELIDEIL